MGLEERRYPQRYHKDCREPFWKLVKGRLDLGIIYSRNIEPYRIKPTEGRRLRFSTFRIKLTRK